MKFLEKSFYFLEDKVVILVVYSRLIVSIYGINEMFGNFKFYNLVLLFIILLLLILFNIIEFFVCRKLCCKERSGVILVLW